MVVIPQAPLSLMNPLASSVRLPAGVGEVGSLILMTCMPSSIFDVTSAKVLLPKVVVVTSHASLSSSNPLMPSVIFETAVGLLGSLMSII